MTSIREETRTAQRAEFAKRGEEALAEQTLSVYDAVDALTPDQRSLLVQKLLTGAHQHIADAADNVEETLIMAGHMQLASSLIALAGYITASDREDAGWTSTGDKAVTETLTLFGDVLKAQVQSAMPPELQAVAQEVIAAARERAAKGEDYGKALFDEVEKRRADGTIEAPAAAAAADKPADSFGMYL